VGASTHPTELASPTKISDVPFFCPFFCLSPKTGQWKFFCLQLPTIRFHQAVCLAALNLLLSSLPEKEVVWKLTRSNVGKTLPPEMQGGNPVYRTSQVSLIRKEIEP